MPAAIYTFTVDIILKMTNMILYFYLALPQSIPN